MTDKKGVVTPGTDEQPEGEDPLLTGADVTEYRSLSARLNYLSADRPDSQYADKELCRCMSSPTKFSMARLHRVARLPRR